MSLQPSPASHPGSAATPVRRRSRGQSAPREAALGRWVEGQQDLLRLVASKAELAELLERLALLGRDVFGSSACAVRLVERGSGSIRHEAVVPSAEGDAGSRTFGAAHKPSVDAALGEKRIILEDCAVERSTSGSLPAALAKGFRGCWAEPFEGCDEDLAGAVTLFFEVPRQPSATEDLVLRSLANLAGMAVLAVRREEAGRSATQRFDSLTAALPGVVYQRLVTPEGDIRYTYISEGAKELFGVEPSEILSNPQALFSRHGPDYASKFKERLLQASQTLSMWDVEATIVAADGRKKYTHAVARPQRQADGAVLWTGVILDETRTREAIVDSLSQGFLLFDAEDRLVLRNSQILNFYPDLQTVAVPGSRYVDVIRQEVASSLGLPLDHTDESPDFRERLARHAEASSIFERQIGPDRWILVDEHRTRDGGSVVVYTEITELKRREKEIHHLAYHDGLTGLPNRLLLQQRLAEALAAAGDERSVTVMCLDVDHFKRVNDTLGHGMGDALLKTISDRLRRCVRPSDTVARLGGDEFAIIVVGLPEPDYANVLARRILRALSEPAECDGHRVATGISIGISCSATDGSCSDLLLKNADLALYRAKADGRGTFRFFEADMDARAQERRSLEMDLRSAIANDQLEVHYQAQVDVDRNSIAGFEALLRWHHPVRGLVSPAEFIPLAEETGLINQIGLWVLHRACQDATGWPESVRIAVNVSPAQFKHHDLHKLVAGILEETGITPGRLELEITESLLLRDTDANLEALRKLKDLGLRVSMDDFGTGYSSLSNLRSFPFDKIKIDRSFVRELGSNLGCAAIVKAVLGLGQSLGVSTCAEGVETLDQLARLRHEGCTEVQGYYFSVPGPLSVADRLLASGLHSVSEAA